MSGGRGPRKRAGALFSQNALFVIRRTALSPGPKMVRGRFVDDMKNGRVKSRFVAAEVARDVRHDVHAGTPALKALRMIVSLAATRDGKHRLRSIAFYDIVAAFVHASKDEVVGGLFPKTACWRKESDPAVEGTLWHSNGFETVAAVLHESTQNARMEREQGNARILSPQRPCGNVRVSWRRTSDALLDRLDRVMADEFEAKMLGRVGRGHLAEVKFLKRQYAGMRVRCVSAGAGEPDTSQSSLCCLDLPTRDL